MDLSIVIVSYNTCGMLRDCLNALPAATEGLITETFVVDNNSPDDSAAMVAAEFPEVHLTASKENHGFTGGNNIALRHVVGRNVLLLNPDTEAAPDSLTLMSRYLDTHPDVGAVGPKLLNTDGSLQPSGKPLPTPWRDFLGHTGLWKLKPGLSESMWHYGREDFDTAWETDSVTGACLMTRKAILDQVGLLEEAFFMFYEEVELCWRIRRAGYKVLFLPEARVVHHWMGSVRQQSKAMTKRLFRSMAIYYRKTMGWRGVIAYPIVWYGLGKNELLHLAVAVKRRLRSAKLIR
ncbi:MAG: putative glycosyltransferase [Chthonomonadaceae bacterium]|nr:putative glycosyltransferase [Chthonomonadaceae bacterium]